MEAQSRDIRVNFPEKKNRLSAGVINPMASFLAKDILYSATDMRLGWDKKDSILEMKQKWKELRLPKSKSPLF